MESIESLPTVETAKKLGILPEEYDKIQEILGRKPNFTELSIFSVMWSEHCSYKNSIVWLKKLPKDSPRMLAKAREERAILIKEAKEASEKMVAEAKDKAKAEYDRILADAQLSITQQKNAALIDVKNQVGSLVIEVAEKVLRKELSNKAEQEGYIKQLADGVKLN